MRRPPGARYARAGLLSARPGSLARYPAGTWDRRPRQAPGVGRIVEARPGLAWAGDVRDNVLPPPSAATKRLTDTSHFIIYVLFKAVGSSLALAIATYRRLPTTLGNGARHGSFPGRRSGLAGLVPAGNGRRHGHLLLGHLAGRPGPGPGGRPPWPLDWRPIPGHGRLRRRHLPSGRPPRLRPAARPGFLATGFPAHRQPGPGAHRLRLLRQRRPGPYRGRRPGHRPLLAPDLRLGRPGTTLVSLHLLGPGPAAVHLRLLLPPADLPALRRPRL